MHSYYLNEGESIDETHDGVHILRQGTIEIMDRNSTVLRTVEAKDFWGEHSMLSDEPYPYYTRAKVQTEVCFLKAEYVLDIPIVRWKLLESHSKHTHQQS